MDFLHIIWMGFLLLCSEHSAGSHSREKRIIGGEGTPISHHPYIVSLQINNIHKCGGSILSERIILTAAHCTELFEKTDIRVEAGHGKLLYGEDRPRVIDVLRHENYAINKTDGKYDLALLKLDSDIGIDDITKREVTLFNKNDLINEGDSATVMGWGLTFYEFVHNIKEIPEKLNATIQRITFTNIDRDGKEVTIQGLLSSARADELMSTDVRIIHKKSCSELTDRTIGKDQICASDWGKNICSGDSGGPLMIGGRQAGIVSWTREELCPRTSWPVVYTSVPTFRDWIDIAKKNLTLKAEETPWRNGRLMEQLERKGIKNVNVRVQCSDLTREEAMRDGGSVNIRIHS